MAASTLSADSAVDEVVEILSDMPNGGKCTVHNMNATAIP